MVSDEAAPSPAMKITGQINKYVLISGTVAVLMSTSVVALDDRRHAPDAMEPGCLHQQPHKLHQVPAQFPQSNPDFSILPPSVYPQQIPPVLQPQPFPNQERLRQERQEQEEAWRRSEELAWRARQEQARRQQQREEQGRLGQGRNDWRNGSAADGGKPEPKPSVPVF